jgi:hypothetical protein
MQLCDGLRNQERTTFSKLGVRRQPDFLFSDN